MLQYGGPTPYNAVLGLQPMMLPDIEDTRLAIANDGTGEELGASRGAIRFRELALGSIVGATAQSRIQRATDSNTRVAAQVEDLRLGDLVG